MQVASPEVDAGNPGFLESKSLFDGDGKNRNWTPCIIGYHISSIEEEDSS